MRGANASKNAQLTCDPGTRRFVASGKHFKDDGCPNTATATTKESIANMPKKEWCKIVAGPVHTIWPGKKSKDSSNGHTGLGGLAGDP